MSSPIIHHEKYREEFSMSVAVACDISRSSITVLYHDFSLDRSIARSAVLNTVIDMGNVCMEVSRLIFLSMREFGIPSSAVKKIGCTAPMDISDALENGLDPTEMFLPPDVEIMVLPFVSAYADGRFAATLAAAPLEDGVLTAYFGKTLNLAYYKDEKLSLASVPLAGAFDGTALESGMPCEYGAIDEVSREDNGTVCYSVVGDGDSVGVSPSAALDAICIMLGMGVIDSDGILTDRDMFYIGEDYFISQKDVRAVQSDKAKSKAALECFIKAVGDPSAVYFTGEAFAGSGMKRLTELGVIPKAIAEKAGFSRSTAEQGIIAYITDELKQEQLSELIYSADDIGNGISDDIEDIYITNLSF